MIFDSRINDLTKTMNHFTINFSMFIRVNFSNRNFGTLYHCGQPRRFLCDIVKIYRNPEQGAAGQFMLQLCKINSTSDSRLHGGLLVRLGFNCCAYSQHFSCQKTFVKHAVRKRLRYLISISNHDIYGRGAGIKNKRSHRATKSDLALRETKMVCNEKERSSSGEKFGPTLARYIFV